MDGNGIYLWDYLASSKKPIVLYGTGDGADKILDFAEERGIRIAAVFASDEFARTRMFRDYNVEKLSDVEERLSGFIVLIAFGTDKTDVLDKIYDLTEKYEVYAPDMPIFGGSVYTPDYFAENRESLEKARSLFEDEESRDVFDKWLEYRLSGDINILASIAVSRGEITELLELGREECFVDVGAYKGDTIDEFLKLTEKKFSKIIAIEPDIKNFLYLRRRFYAYGSAIFAAVNAAASDSDGIIDFTVKTGRGGGIGVSQKRGRTVKIASIKLDTLCKAEKPTYIKIDAEGAESKVINGAGEIIKKHKPKMLAAVYHRPEDMYALPIALNALNPKYRMFLRKTRCVPGWEFNLILI